jgi:putative hydrolase of the HAD superfamily
MQDIRLITFDLDDTLWPCLPVIQAAEAELFRWLAEHAPAVAAGHDVGSLREHRKALAAERPELAHDLTALRQTQLELLMAEHGHDPALARAGSDHFRAARNRVAPFPEVAEALARLRGRYRLVSVTNGNAQVERTPLAGCFHRNLTAADVGAAKPDPALFHAACAWAGVVPAQALHVGDDPQRDIAAAQTIGMRTAWINRAAAAWPADLPGADLETTDLAGLVSKLESNELESQP